MVLIKLSEKEETPQREIEMVHRVDVREPLPEENARIVARVLSILDNLNVDYIRIEKGVLSYVHYPSYKGE